MSKFPDMMSLGELQISFPLFFVPKIHLMTSYLETPTMKNLIKMKFFTIKIHCCVGLMYSGEEDACVMLL